MVVKTSQNGIYARMNGNDQWHGERNKKSHHEWWLSVYVVWLVTQYHVDNVVHGVAQFMHGNMCERIFNRQTVCA